MSDYSRFVSYIYLYENGIKTMNAGFVKVESRAGQCRISMMLKNVYTGLEQCQVYMFIRFGQDLRGVYMGDVQIKNHSGEWNYRTDTSNMAGSGYRLDQMSGMIIRGEGDKFYGTRWDNGDLDIQRFRTRWDPMESPDEDRENSANMNMQPGAEGETSERINIGPEAIQEFPERRKVEPENVEENPERREMEPETMEENPERREMGPETDQELPETRNIGPENEQKSPERRNIEPETVEENPEKNVNWNQASERSEMRIPEQSETGEKTLLRETPGVSEPRIQEPIDPGENKAVENRDIDIDITGSQRENPENEGQIVTMEENERCRNFGKILEQCPGMYPFEDDSVESCVRLEPQDIGRMPIDCWAYGSNSFLLHGYYSYRHLILARMKSAEDSGGNYILGVPGTKHSREAFMANMFGFRAFKPIREGNEGSSDFGYWYTFLA